MADPEIFISGGPQTDLRGDPLQSRFNDSLYKQPNFFPKRPPPKSAFAKNSKLPKESSVLQDVTTLNIIEEPSNSFF